MSYEKKWKNYKRIVETPDSDKRVPAEDEERSTMFTQPSDIEY